MDTRLKGVCARHFLVYIRIICNTGITHHRRALTYVPGVVKNHVRCQYASHFERIQLVNHMICIVVVPIDASLSYQQRKRKA